MGSTAARATIDYGRAKWWRRASFSWESGGYGEAGFETAEEACDAAYEAWKQNGAMVYSYTDAAHARMRETGEDRGLVGGDPP